MLLWNKLKKARELLGYSQGEAAIHSGIAQKDISLMEGGKKKFIPEEYIHFLYNGGIDINSLYAKDSDEIKKIKNDDDTPGATMLVDDDNTEQNTNTPIVITGGKSRKAPKVAPPTAPPTVVLTPQIITVDQRGEENILYINAKAAAGYLNGYSDSEYMEMQPSFNLPGLRDGTFRAFEVTGNSMHPTIHDKDMIIGRWVEKLDYIREGRVHIIVTKKDGIVVKRILNRIEKYGYLVAKSDAVDNRNEYPNIEIYPDDILEVWYAVWHGSFNFTEPSDVYKRINNVEADLNEVMRLLKQSNILGK